MEQTSQPPCSQKELWELFDYVDGELLPKIPGVTTCLSGNGYLQTRWNKKAYTTHRLIYFMHTGIWSSRRFHVDHIDGNPLNNRIENLQYLSLADNVRKGRMRPNNTSGYKGVSWNKAAKKWAVCVFKAGSPIYLGLFEDLELAGLVADEARDLIFKGQRPERKKYA